VERTRLRPHRPCIPEQSAERAGLTSESTRPLPATGHPVAMACLAVEPQRRLGHLPSLRHARRMHCLVAGWRWCSNGADRGPTLVLVPSDDSTIFV